MSAPHAPSPLSPRAPAAGATVAGRERAQVHDAALPPAPPPPWRRVRVIAPTGPVDVSLPLARTVADLVDELLTSLVPGAPVTDPGPWHLHRLGGPPLDPGTPLAAARPVDGEVLHLTHGSPPPPAHHVDDALDVLGTGAAAAGRWSTTSAAGAVAGLAVALGAAAALAALLATPRSAVLPGALGLAALVAAVRLRRGSAGPGGGEVAALAGLPAWACAGPAVAAGAGGGALPDVVLAAAGLAVGAAGAALTVRDRAGWWALPATAGILTAAGGSVVLAGWLSLHDAAAVAGPVLLALVAALPWLVTRTALWSADAPAGRTEAELVARGTATRRVLSGVAAGVAAVVGACAVVLVRAPDHDATCLGLALAVVVGLRARRSRFVVESGAHLLAGAVPLAVALADVALRGSTGAREGVLGVLVASLAAALGLLAVLRQARAGSRGRLERLTRARVRRAVDVVEALVAVSVVPLLAGALGLYAAASDAGSQL